MPPRRPLLLIEALDALGSHEQDAALRAAALRSLAGAARIVVAPWRAAAAPPDALTVARAVRAVRAAFDEHAPERVVIAAGRDAADALVRALPPAADVRWWPTAVEDGGHAHAPALPLFAPREASDATALSAAVIEASAGRERVPLWDGDFVLAPAPLEGADGRAAIEAFATVAEEWHSLDLVVLADPQPEFEAEARRRGVAPRVHFAGRAPREAELTWLASTSAVLLTSGAPLAAAWLLRALAAGAPLLPIGDGAVAGRVASWLDARHALPAPCRRREEAAASLAAVLQRGPRVDRAVIVGRELAARHRIDAWSPRLAAPWGDPGRETREVA